MLHVANISSGPCAKTNPRQSTSTDEQPLPAIQEGRHLSFATCENTIGKTLHSQGSSVRGIDGIQSQLGNANNCSSTPDSKTAMRARSATKPRRSLVLLIFLWILCVCTAGELCLNLCSDAVLVLVLIDTFFTFSKAKLRRPVQLDLHERKFLGRGSSFRLCCDQRRLHPSGAGGMRVLGHYCKLGRDR